MPDIPPDAPRDYHLWYYNSEIWKRTSWAGAVALKSPLDMWNYQEILFQRRPSLIVEFGTWSGGATVFFAAIIRDLRGRGRVLSLDIDPFRLVPRLLGDLLIVIVTV